MPPKSLILILTALLFFTSCARGGPPPQEETSTAVGEPIPSVPNSGFTLISSAVAEGGALPVAYTCDGESATLPLAWANAPEATQSFAVVMHHIPGPGDTHWYWVLYNIPATVSELPQNSAGLGTLGTNSVNEQNAYAPPCSKGPGEKLYTYTVYALAAEPTLPATAVSRAVLLEAIQEITLASATLNVTYSR